LADFRHFCRNKPATLLRFIRNTASSAQAHFGAHIALSGATAIRDR